MWLWNGADRFSPRPEIYMTVSKKRIIKILDTTLRDGEQAPGCSMNPGEKIEVVFKISSTPSEEFFTIPEDYTKVNLTDANNFVD